MLVPIELMFFSTCSREPSPMATTATTEAMPMMMPSIVRKVRSRCAFIASSAMPKASVKRSRSAARPPAEAGRGGSCGGAGRSTTPCIRAVGRSPMISPSRISMIRSACSATAMSWVTMMIVWPSACSSCRIFITSSPLPVSSAPVGSSARITLPPFISARAMETRCCCPPESCPGR